MSGLKWFLDWFTPQNLISAVVGSLPYLEICLVQTGLYATAQKHACSYASVTVLTQDAHAGAHMHADTQIHATIFVNCKSIQHSELQIEKNQPPANLRDLTQLSV